MAVFHPLSAWEEGGHGALGLILYQKQEQALSQYSSEITIRLAMFHGYLSERDLFSAPFRCMSALLLELALVVLHRQVRLHCASLFLTEKAFHLCEILLRL